MRRTINTSDEVTSIITGYMNKYNCSFNQAVNNLILSSTSEASEKETPDMSAKLKEIKSNQSIIYKFLKEQVSTLDKINIVYNYVLEQQGAGAYKLTGTN